MKPYYETETGKLYNGDWLDNNLPDKCANLIICDPPYYKVKGEFDFKWKTFDDYLEDVEKWATECKRILSDNGSLYWYGDDKNIAYTQVIIDKYFNLENSLIWYKYNLRGGMFGSTGGDNVRSYPICTERILFYSQDEINLTNCVFHIRDYIISEIKKSKGSISLKDINRALGTATNGGGVASSCFSLNKTEPTMVTKEMYVKLQEWCEPYLRQEYEELRQEYEELRQEYEELRRPFNNTLNLNEVLQFNTDTSNKYKHDTVKPESLTRALISTSSKIKDIVVIPFGGSGTECQVAEQENRIWKGYEIKKEYCDIITKRIKQSTAQLRLPGF